MSYPDLPATVKNMLAEKGRREHHRQWHAARGGRPIDAHWSAPRLQGQLGSGIDFFGMHRQMIEEVNKALLSANDQNWLAVSGWDQIPWTDNDSEWPVPKRLKTKPAAADDWLWQRYRTDVQWADRPDTIQEMKAHADRFRDSNYLENVSLDGLGIAIESPIHAWMHIRWSGPPPIDPSSAHINNDWLFTPWSSHVNKVFWKLHGWIDDRIGDWEAARGETADFSDAWIGPRDAPHNDIVLLAAHRNLQQ